MSSHTFITLLDRSSEVLALLEDVLWEKTSEEVHLSIAQRLQAELAATREKVDWCNAAFAMLETNELAAKKR
jgi:hypothetical protein